MEDHATTAPTPKPDDVASPASMGLQWLREIVTAAIAITILAIASVMLMETFHSARYVAVNGTNEAQQAERQLREKAFGSEKDILLYVLALLGTVTGYFFGRVPAELHAVQAQGRADDAKDAESKAKADKTRIMNRTMDTVNQALSVPPFVHAAPRGVPDAAQDAAHLTTARQDLEQLRDWLQGLQS